MKIKVTKKDIKNGLPCSDSSCPIALAVRRTLKHREIVTVDSLYVGINGKYSRLSKRAIRFVEKFDSNEIVKPFEFNIKLKK